MVYMTSWSRPISELGHSMWEGTVIAWPDVYNAATRGIIEGAEASGLEWSPATFAEMFKYIIWPEFYEQNLTILINLDKWNSLSRQQQNLIMDVVIEMEPEMAKYFSDLMKDVLAEMQANGQEVITLSPDDAKQYLDAAYTKSWEVAQKKVSPDDYTKLRQLLMK